MTNLNFGSPVIYPERLKLVVEFGVRVGYVNHKLPLNGPGQCNVTHF